MRHDAGFTLLELLVVLAIMALMLAAIPGLALPGVNAAIWAGKIQAVAYRLESAHDRAVASGHEIVLGAADLQSDGLVASLPSADSKLIFFPDGSVSGGPIKLKFHNDRRMVKINEVSGQVALSEK
ncbi:pilus assembly FimT family protein [Acidiphilium iwatense]|uniref:Prepilin-type N-terminal cleavage/methylation domain-containing protein n=1 Tax=Acidiphilium iwatense TaxID=768198 RepID=A0ABS9DUC9_9PROT|nr:prepilin-type N-terminal cleavage/methylation domain-containing protein [Acidiphilium iwatense]MCF3945755.1 prepilin-type N-terminal cleavage/methylation domain-containing protein [Acidiphilium iwatense]